MKKRLIGGSVVAILVGVTGCGSVASQTTASTSGTTPSNSASSNTASHNTASSKPVNLVVWSAPDTIAQKWYATEIKKFEQVHPNIHVKVLQEGIDNNYAKYTSAITGGQAPDLILTYSYNIIPTWAASGLLMPMDTYLQQAGFDSSTFFPFVNNMQKFNGHTWGLVQAYDDVLLTWNKADFKAAGLDPNTPPKTLDELWADAKKLTKFKNGKLVQAGFIPWLENGNDLNVWNSLEGGTLYSNGKWNVGGTPMLNAMKLFQQYNNLLGGAKQWEALIEKSVGSTTVTPSSSPQSPFYSGQVAMQLVGDWYPTFVYKQYAPNLDYGEAPPPVANGVKYGTNQMIGTDVFCLPKGSQHPQEATELAVFLDNQDSAILWDQLESNMPPIKSAALDPSFLQKVPPEAPSVLAAKQNLVVPYPSSAILGQIVGDPTSGTILATEAQKLYYGKVSPTTALNEVTQAVNKDETTFESEHPQWFKK